MANSEDKITKIEEISESTASKQLDAESLEPTTRLPPNKEQFDALMNQDQQRAPVVVKSEASTINSNSLMDQIRSINNKVESVSKSSPDHVIAQAQEVIKQIEDVKTQLASPNLELKGSVQTVLKNKLSHIDDSLKVAMNRAGMEYTPHDLSTNSGLLNPIDRFLGFLTHGQYQLQKLAQDVQMMHLQQKEMSPASMLAIQIKVGYIQQELEFFANMLNKALESTKTIMNVQI